MADTNRPDGSQVFHRDQTQSAMLLLVPLAVALLVTFVLESLVVKAIGGAATLGLLYLLVTLPRQNTLTVTADAVSWPRRGRTCTIDLANVTRVVARKVVVNGGAATSRTYVLPAFEMDNGAEILCQALYGGPGSQNARMVDDAVDVISGRLAELQRAEGIDDEMRIPRPDAPNPAGEPSAPGTRTFTTSRKYLVPIYVVPILGLFVFGSITLVCVLTLNSVGLVYGALLGMCIYLISKLIGSMKLVVDEESIKMVVIGKTSEVRLADLRLVRQVSDVRGYYEVTTLEFVYNDGRVESCQALIGPMWPDKPGWAMVREAAALINGRIGHG